MFLVDSVLKNKSRTYELKDLNGEKKRNHLWKRTVTENLFMGYYPELGSHIRDKVKVVLDLSNYATENKFMLKMLIHLI